MEHLFTVAGHTFKLLLPERYPVAEWLAPYMPFREERRVEPLFTLEVKTCATSLLREVRQEMHRFNEEPPYLWMNDTYDTYGLSIIKDCLSSLVRTEAGYVKGSLCLPERNPGYEDMLYFNSCLKLMYVLNTTTLNTLMLHASVVTQAGNGYAFLGKSGTGKSTHSQLWLRYLEGYELLNDDHPIIRLMDDEVIVYGSPWSGKTPCYKNKQACLKAVVRLEQASENKIIRLRGIQAYAAFSPSCSGMRWQREMADAIHQTIVAVTEHCRLLHLKCLPDEEAARLCCQTIHER